MRYFGFIVMLVFTQSAHAENILCLPEESENPVYRIDDIQAENPRLSVHFQNGKVANGLPCVATMPSSAFDCEQFVGESGLNRYFQFTRHGSGSKQYFVQITAFQLRANIENGVRHKITSGALELYNCRKEN